MYLSEMKGNDKIIPVCEMPGPQSQPIPSLLHMFQLALFTRGHLDFPLQSLVNLFCAARLVILWNSAFSASLKL